MLTPPALPIADGGTVSRAVVRVGLMLVLAPGLLGLQSAHPPPAQAETGSAQLFGGLVESRRAGAESVDEDIDAFEEAQAWKLQADDSIAIIREAFPTEFAAGWITDTAVNLAFIAQPPAGAIEVLEAAGHPYVLVEGYDASEVEIIAAADQVHSAAVALAGEDVTVTSGPVIQDQVFEIFIAGQPQNRGGEPLNADSVAAEVTAAVGEEALVGFGVRTVLENPEDVGLAGYGQAGGTPLDATDGGLSCTSGFVVTSATGPDLGVITAGHCSNNLRQISPGGNFLFNFRQEHKGTGGDMQWMRSPTMMDAWFHVNYGVGRPLHGKDAVEVGDPLCLFGRIGGSDCGSVRSLNKSRTQDGVTTTGLAESEYTLVEKGDSGGPVFINNTALGIITAYGAYYDYFTPINPVLSRFNLQLCIDPPGCQ
jgi:hypothetical protein